MQKRKIGILGLAVLAMTACGSHKAAVRRLATESLYCDAKELEIIEIDRDAASNITHYEVRGCDRKQRYVCNDNALKAVLLASGRVLDIDPRHCMREMR